MHEPPSRRKAGKSEGVVPKYACEYYTKKHTVKQEDNKWKGYASAVIYTEYFLSHQKPKATAATFVASLLLNR
jgi:hypothetical protein